MISSSYSTSSSFLSVTKLLLEYNFRVLFTPLVVTKELKLPHRVTSSELESGIIFSLAAERNESVCLCPILYLRANRPTVAELYLVLVLPVSRMLLSCTPGSVLQLC